MTELVLVLAIVMNGLQAGTYYTWASGVMPGLAQTDDRTFVHAMQRMNVAIVNPVFLASFLGAPVVSVFAGVLVDGDGRWWSVAGAVLAVATLVITIAGNVPRNNALEAAGPIDQITDPGTVRHAFEKPWVRLNAVRALTSTLALAGFAVAALV